MFGSRFCILTLSSTKNLPITCTAHSACFRNSTSRIFSRSCKKKEYRRTDAMVTKPRDMILLSCATHSPGTPVARND